MSRLFLAVLFIFANLGFLSGQTPPRIRVLILTGVHNHDWRATTPVFREILERTGRFEVRVNEEVRGNGPETFASYDVLFLNYNDMRFKNGPWWDDRARQAMLDFVRNGKGLVCVHGALAAFWGWPEFESLLGGAFREGTGHAPDHSFTVNIIDNEHPITKGMPPSFTQPVDEFYHRLVLLPDIHVLAKAWDDPQNCVKPGQACGSGKDEPVMWTHIYGIGRVFVMAPGDNVKPMQGLGFQLTLQRGTEWAGTGQVTIPVPPDLT